MSKVDAPEIEPTAAALPKKPDVALHRRYMDFSPVRKPVKNGAKTLEPSSNLINVKRTTTKGAPIRPAPVAARRIVDLRPVSAPTESEVDARGFVDGMPVARKKVVKPVSTVPLVEPEVEEETISEIEPEEETGPLAEFNELGFSETEEDLEAEAPLDEAQEDFLAEEDPEDYVETVLSQVSETRTETTVRRSPFLKNFHIEKRPLSGRVPVQPQVASVDALAPTPHEEYKEEDFARRADRAPENADEPVETKAEKTGSRLGMVLTVAITILLGAGVGVFVYLAFFQ